MLQPLKYSLISSATLDHHRPLIFSSINKWFPSWECVDNGNGLITWPSAISPLCYFVIPFRTSHFFFFWCTPLAKRQHHWCVIPSIRALQTYIKLISSAHTNKIQTKHESSFFVTQPTLLIYERTLIYINQK